MNKQVPTVLAILLALLLAIAPAAYGQDDEAPQEDAEPTEDAAEPAADPGGPKTLSGMSILGNEEAPKSLVIIPWKSSEIGADLGLDDSLDERPEPVDREVFLRELAFYEIRAGE